MGRTHTRGQNKTNQRKKQRKMEVETNAQITPKPRNTRLDLPRHRTQMLHLRTPVTTHRQRKTERKNTRRLEPQKRTQTMLQTIAAMTPVLLI